MGALRVVQIMLSKGFGGGERYFEDLALTLADGGHRVMALCHRRYPRLAPLEAHPDIEVSTVNLRGLWDRWTVREAADRVRAFGADVMHTHMARAAWAGSAITTRVAVPLVATLHNYVDLKYYRGVRAFVPTTRDQARYLASKGVASERIHTIPNFSCLTPATGPRESGAGALAFASVGRFVRKKGYSELLEAFARMVDEGVDARLVLGGDGPERERLVALAEALGIGHRVRFVGWVEDVAAFLADAEVFVLPSLDEPFGIVMLEAMAVGVPIVTTRTQGPREVLDDRTAWFADTGDVESLATALAAAAADPEARRARAQRALERYVAHYHHTAVVPRLVRLYEQTTL